MYQLMCLMYIDMGIPVELYTYYFVSQLIMCFIIILGNLGTLFCFVKYRKLQKQRYALICSLALSDLMVGLSNGINIVWEKLRNSDQCMTSASALLLSNIIMSVVFISVVHLIVIGMDRWIAVMFPLRYPTVVTVKTTNCHGDNLLGPTPDLYGTKLDNSHDT